MYSAVHLFCLLKLHWSVCCSRAPWSNGETAGKCSQFCNL